MSGKLPERVDPWRMVAERRCFEAELPLARFARLADSLAGAGGSVQVWIGFDADALGQAFVRVRVTGALPLLCQRSLEPFALPVEIDARLGLIRTEVDEAALPPGYEPLLVESGELLPLDLVEDELILALPVVPLSPRENPDAPVWQDPGFDDFTKRASPFAALRSLRDGGQTSEH